MLILVHGSGFTLDSELRNDVHEKMELSFARFSRQIGKINAYLEDLNGPKKGLDKVIRLVVDIEREPMIIIEEKGEDWYTLLDSVAVRAIRTTTRQVKKSRSLKDRMSMAGDEHLVDLEQTIQLDSEWNPLRDRPDRQ